MQREYQNYTTILALEWCGSAQSSGLGTLELMPMGFWASAHVFVGHGWGDSEQGHGTPEILEPPRR
jgi:hypothetical protein